MATNITIGTSNDDVNKITKSFNIVDSVSARIKEPCDILYPTFILNYDARFASCNYIYVGEWNRYYYIDNITLSSGGTMVLNCVVDVLKSWSESILGITTDVQVNEGKGSFNNISDSALTLQNGTAQRYYNFVGSSLTPITFSSESPINSLNYVFIKSM